MSDPSRTSAPLAVVPVVMAGWSDLGVSDAVWQVAHKDEAGNGALSDALVRESRNTAVYTTSRPVSLVGVEDLTVIATPTPFSWPTASAARTSSTWWGRWRRQRREKKNLHRKVHRHLGWHDSIDSGPRFQVKHIMVEPGAGLTLQLHHHRVEHWIVVKGTAEVTNGDQVLTLTENQSTDIPLGQKHRPANAGKVPLEIIEVRSGGHLGEDDIVRFEDGYGPQ